MKTLMLQNKSSTGSLIKAIFAPDKGMNLISFQRANIEVMEQTTKDLFDFRCAGLGALIGPHFHHRDAKDIPSINDDLFPHIKSLREKKVLEPFSHGIARYVPWKYAASDTQIKAHLSGSHEHKGVFLRDLEGFDFEMKLDIRLLENGLFISYHVDAEKPSTLGLHYYYALSNQVGKVWGDTNGYIRKDKTWNKMPEKMQSSTSKFAIDIDSKTDLDIGISPLDPQEENKVILDTDDYSLHIYYNSDSNKEGSLQIYKPQEASFVCIEPLSAKFPRKPHLLQSTLEVKIEIFPSNNA